MGPSAFDVAFGAGLHANAPAIARMPCRPGEPIRLNRIGTILPPGTSPVARGETRQILQEALKRLCEPWDRNVQRLIDRYFGFLDRQIDRSRGEIEARLARFHDLYRTGDVLFSAAAPLPRARIERDTLRSYSIPVAFWTGTRLVALFDAAAGETPRRLRERREAFAAAGVDVLLFPATASPEADDAFLKSLLGPAMTRFFETETLPAAPLAPH